MTIFVVVGNRKEFDLFKTERKIEKGVYCVNSPESLIGRIIGPKDTIIFYGTSTRRRDIQKIMDEIERCKVRFKARK